MGRRFGQSHLIGFAVLLGFLAGCQTPPGTHSEWGIPDHRPTTGFAAEDFEPRRVLILPVATERVPFEEFAERLDPVLLSEIGKTVRFEMLPIDRKTLEAETGQETFAAHDVLPPNFFARLQAETQADAVLFTELTVLQAWRPIAIGLRFRMVDLQTHEVVWAFDDVFDSGNPQVAVSAQRFQRAFNDRPFPLDTSAAVLQSPIAFAEYVVWEALGTFPPST